MNHQIRIALAQTNTIVGDLEGNFRKTREYTGKAEKAGAEIIIFPELTIPGYPPEDLVLKQKFISDNKVYLNRLAETNKKAITIIGFVDFDNDIYNAAAILQQAKIAATHHKICLPNYSVFDEKRYFTPGKRPLIFEYNEIKFGLNICEDIWVPDGVTESQAFRGGAESILSLSESP